MSGDKESLDPQSPRVQVITFIRNELQPWYDEGYIKKRQFQKTVYSVSEEWKRSTGGELKSGWKQHVQNLLNKNLQQHSIVSRLQDLKQQEEAKRNSQYAKVDSMDMDQLDRHMHKQMAEAQHNADLLQASLREKEELRQKLDAASAMYASGDDTPHTPQEAGIMLDTLRHELKLKDYQINTIEHEKRELERELDYLKDRVAWIPPEEPETVRTEQQKHAEGQKQQDKLKQRTDSGSTTPGGGGPGESFLPPPSDSTRSSTPKLGEVEEAGVYRPDGVTDLVPVEQHVLQQGQQQLSNTLQDTQEQIMTLGNTLTQHNQALQDQLDSTQKVMMLEDTLSNHAQWCVYNHEIQPVPGNPSNSSSSPEGTSTSLGISTPSPPPRFPSPTTAQVQPHLQNVHQPAPHRLTAPVNQAAQPPTLTAEASLPLFQQQQQANTPSIPSGVPLPHHGQAAVPDPKTLTYEPLIPHIGRQSTAGGVGLPPPMPPQHQQHIQPPQQQPHIPPLKLPVPAPGSPLFPPVYGSAPSSFQPTSPHQYDPNSPRYQPNGSPPAIPPRGHPTGSVHSGASSNNTYPYVHYGLTHEQYARPSGSYGGSPVKIQEARTPSPSPGADIEVAMDTVSPLTTKIQQPHPQNQTLHITITPQPNSQYPDVKVHAGPPLPNVNTTPLPAPHSTNSKPAQQPPPVPPPGIPEEEQPPPPPVPPKILKPEISEQQPQTTEPNQSGTQDKPPELPPKKEEVDGKPPPEHSTEEATTTQSTVPPPLPPTKLDSNDANQHVVNTPQSPVDNTQQQQQPNNVTSVNSTPSVKPPKPKPKVSTVVSRPSPELDPSPAVATMAYTQHHNPSMDHWTSEYMDPPLHTAHLHDKPPSTRPTYQPHQFHTSDLSLPTVRPDHSDRPTAAGGEDLTSLQAILERFETENRNLKRILQEEQAKNLLKSGTSGHQPDNTSPKTDNGKEPKTRDKKKKPTKEKKEKRDKKEKKGKKEKEKKEKKEKTSKNSKKKSKKSKKSKSEGTTADTGKEASTNHNSSMSSNSRSFLSSKSRSASSRSSSGGSSDMSPRKKTHPESQPHYKHTSVRDGAPSHPQSTTSMPPRVNNNTCGFRPFSRVFKENPSKATGTTPPRRPPTSDESSTLSSTTQTEPEHLHSHTQTPNHTHTQTSPHTPNQSTQTPTTPKKQKKRHSEVTNNKPRLRLEGNVVVPITNSLLAPTHSPTSDEITTTTPTTPQGTHHVSTIDSVIPMELPPGPHVHPHNHINNTGLPHRDDDDDTPDSHWNRHNPKHGPFTPVFYHGNGRVSQSFSTPERQKRPAQHTPQTPPHSYSTPQHATTITTSPSTAPHNRPSLPRSHTMSSMSAQPHFDSYGSPPHRHQPLHHLPPHPHGTPQRYSSPQLVTRQHYHPADSSLYSSSPHYRGPYRSPPHVQPVFVFEEETPHYVYSSDETEVVRRVYTSPPRNISPQIRKVATPPRRATHSVQRHWVHAV